MQLNQEPFVLLGIKRVPRNIVCAKWIRLVFLALPLDLALIF
jgi:hypothetical protein